MTDPHRTSRRLWISLIVFVLAAIFALTFTGCVISPFAPTAEPEDVTPLAPRYCTTNVYGSWTIVGGQPALVTDSVRYIGCAGRVKVVTP